MYKISVMCPTRKRAEKCVNSCNSLLENATNPEDIEVLLMFDEDDQESYDHVKKYYEGRENVKFFISERYGYTQLHKYYNFLAEEAQGPWLFLWNDDSVMNTVGWDDVVLEHECSFKVIGCSEDIDQGALFPIFPKKWVETTGRVSNNCSNDTWLELVARPLGIMVKEPRLSISHLRETSQFDDDTRAERVYDSARFNSSEQAEERKIDREKIQEAMSNAN